MPKPPPSTRYDGRIGDWVLYNSHQLIAFNKPAGLPIQPDKSGDLALTQLGAAYTRTELLPIHRLDRPVSGVVLLAKKPAAQTALTRQWQAGEVRKTYLAIVAERPPHAEAKLVDFLLEGGGKENLTTIVPAETPGARRAELTYRYLGSSERYHLLEIDLLTGRKHQIRAQLAAIGCPLRGDTKYGFNRSQAGGIIDLHAWKLVVANPVSQEPLFLLAPPPSSPVWEAMQPYWGG